MLKLGRGMALSAAFLGTGLSEKWSLLKLVPVSESKKLPRGGNSPVGTAVPQGARLSTKPWNNSLALTKTAGVKGNSCVTLHSSPQEFQPLHWERGLNLLSFSENLSTCYILHPKTVPKNVGHTLDRCCRWYPSTVCVLTCWLIIESLRKDLQAHRVQP